jgi:hypothetical protein
MLEPFATPEGAIDRGEDQAVNERKIGITEDRTHLVKGVRAFLDRTCYSDRLANEGSL